MDAQHDVFISHSSKDAKATEDVRYALESAGIGCWVSTRDIPTGRRFDATIVSAIEDSRAFVLILSYQSALSNHVLNELALAFCSRVPIVPLRLHDLPVPPAMKYYLVTTQWFDAFPGPLVDHISRFVRAVAALLSGDAPASPRLPPVAMPGGTPAPAEPSATPARAGIITNSVGMSFVLIPPGTFMMGSDASCASSDERPMHEVRLTSLDISAFRARFAQAAAHEATDPQFRAFGMRSRAARCDRRAFCSKIVEEPAVWDTISLVRLACTSLHGSAAQ